MNERNLSD